MRSVACETSISDLSLSRGPLAKREAFDPSEAAELPDRVDKCDVKEVRDWALEKFLIYYKK